MKRVVLLSLLSGWICGCGESRQGAEPVYPVRGVITFKGLPVVGADVTFFNPDRKRSAFGRTNDKGEYQLTTFSMNDGAVDGKSVLTVTKFVAPIAVAAEADVESAAYQPPIVGRPEPKKRVKPEIPERYSSLATSGLIAVVSQDGPNVLNFDLTM